MYEKIMELPLFKGISREQVSLFLEKTSVEFMNFQEGETIVKQGEQVRKIWFVIKGRIMKLFRFKYFSVVITEIEKAGNVIGAENLFGMATTYSQEIRAAEDVTIMGFSKEQYIKLLRTDGIYSLNFLNFLSARAQRPLKMLLSEEKTGLERNLNNIINIISNPFTEAIKFYGNREEIAGVLGVKVAELTQWVSEREKGDIKDFYGRKLEFEDGL